MVKHLVRLVAIVLCLGASWHARAQFTEPGAFVTQVAGDAVVLGADSGKPVAIPLFAKLEPGAKVRIAAGARLQLLFFDGGAQETWVGPAEFGVGERSSVAAAGAAAQTRQLSADLVDSIAKSHQIFSNPQARQSMVRLRAVSGGKIKAAQDYYREMRAQLPDDDITPEVFLLGQLDALRAFADMEAPLAEMMRRQPNSPAVKALYNEFKVAIQSVR